MNVKGAFLHGEFDGGEALYCKIPEGFKHEYDPKEYCWLFTRTAYGLKQAARMFWNKLLKAMSKLGFTRSLCDPCVYYKWINNRLVMWISWIDDMLCIGHPDDIEDSKNVFIKEFNCDNIGEFKEYVGCKIERKVDSIKLTQPVLLQSYKDEFPLSGRDYDTPGEPGKILTKVEDREEVNDKMQTEFRSGVGKLPHMMRWSRPEIWNAVRECSRRMSKSNLNRRKGMMRIMQYCVNTPNRGWTLKPLRKWLNCDREFEFNITGHADSNYATYPETRRNITGYIVRVENSIVATKSGMQKIVALSTTEAEIIAAVQCVQEMLYVMKLIQSLGLKVKKPMIVHSDNKGAVDLVNDWSVGGGTKHMDCRIMFLRELKESGILRIEWIPTTDNESDIYTKNVDKQTFLKHVASICEENPKY